MPKGSQDLRLKVLDRNLCTGCGICIGMCPYIKTIAERVAVIHPCGLEDGNCYKICPRTETDPSKLDVQVFGAEREDQILGVFKSLLYARAVNPEVAGRGQYGGTVSALAAFALDQGEADAVVLAKGNADSYPSPQLARTKEEVLDCSGSKYSACPSMSALHQAEREGSKRTGVVGRPCQITAVRKLQGLTFGEGVSHIPAANVSLAIGIFCFWSLAPEFYDWLTTQVGPAQILSIDIPIEGLEVKTVDRVYRWPVEEIRRFIRPACQECFDSTAELADVSVGSTEFDAAWNTLIIRTQRGAELVEEAQKAGIIETKPYPVERLPLLRRAVLNKKQRVLRAQAEGQADYLSLGDEIKEQILAMEVTES